MAVTRLHARLVSRRPEDYLPELCGNEVRHCYPTNSVAIESSQNNLSSSAPTTGGRRLRRLRNQPHARVESIHKSVQAIAATIYKAANRSEVVDRKRLADSVLVVSEKRCQQSCRNLGIVGKIGIRYKINTNLLSVTGVICPPGKLHKTSSPEICPSGGPVFPRSCRLS